MLNEQKDQQTATLSGANLKSRLVTKKPDMQRSRSYDKLPELISLIAAELDKSI